MRTWFALLFFLTIGMKPFGYTIEPLRVKDIQSCMVTLVGESEYKVWSDEAWRVGDRAEAIVKGGEIIEIRYGGWRHEAD